MKASISEKNVNDWLIRHSVSSTRPIRPPVICKDGFTMSVQASINHYCKPRIDEGPWTHVEIGFPNKIEPLLWQYAESPGEWTDTIYARVPVEVVAAVVEVHGGFSEKSE